LFTQLLTLEIFSHRFYKNLDDTQLCAEMAENDKIVCYELPCHAQQTRNYIPEAGNPFIVPVFLSDAAVGRTAHSAFIRSSPILFGYPFVIAITPDDARSTIRMKELVVEQLQRWTENARDLWSWEAPPDEPDAEMEEVQIPTPMDALKDVVTEIKENGEVVPIEEGEIVDQKALLYEDVDEIPLSNTRISTASSSIHPNIDFTAIPSQEVRRVGVKAGAFNLRVQSGHKDFGTGATYGMSSSRFDSWDSRRDELTMPGSEDPVLLLPDDALFLEFDQNMKAYYFGTGPQAFQHALFNTWETFTHPEYSEAIRVAAAKTRRGISLQDCLDEFTKEEQLGEDDPWYCPQCKKHQQATKKFDLWSVPDVLVVHLKRFSNSRALRDKIEAFVDFPIEGLDLTEMVQERKIAKQLEEEGVDIAQLQFGDLDEPLLYDLYAVDEHRGGLGGGHYRAYASNDVTGQWYQFDDAFVTLSRPEAAVVSLACLRSRIYPAHSNFQNSDAYLLFYKRRTSRPLGGKTHSKIEAARLNSEPSSAAETPVPVHINEQLPTPPDEPLALVTVSSSRKQDLNQANHNWSSTGRWPTPQSESSSISTSPPPMDEADSELPSFSDSQFDAVLEGSLDPLVLSSKQFDFGRTSPTSSNEVEIDPDDEPSGNLETDSMQASPREEMLRDTQEVVDTWNT
jgi:ubiquitin carboxyl-terminal hydrolase 4/11/15